ncbi:LEAF RUST 10 DISEASE-RESISTANCE LOCUS RECEPTOR-LIKE PROTEIN KINASE-like 1.2 [Zingiber officinale]|uniref:LEAF RUST 10 DISEASE-RESISTANCE LOCUS RECEPTOR-LIKE PROTEIN KINASE-like 1.2 n=1 Tax=Zingiber officinale TaxID=94328 RepID=UPI001C4C2ECD|nr:LEAF RUST 10 DISEASE-RESISTANCE LOCUS RECEPTOR-LIKE PROTEIN KINASE-like 1.2 [Zingiber officinale]
MAAGFRSPSPLLPQLLQSLIVPILNCLLMLLPVASHGGFSCPNSTSVPCGNVSISYPFRLSSDEPEQIAPYCGYQSFTLTCRQSDIPILRLGDDDYRVLDINYNYSDVSLVDGVNNGGVPETCSTVHQNVTLPSNLSLSYADADDEVNLALFFDCTTFSRRPISVIPCLQFDESEWEFKYSYYDDPVPMYCHDDNETVLAALETYVGNELGRKYAQILHNGFEFHWKTETDENCSYCESSDGRCWYNIHDASLALTCFCSGGKIEVLPRQRKKPTKLIIGIVIGALAAVGLLCASILFCRYKKKRNYLAASKTFASSASSGPSSMDPEKYSVHFQTNLFSYDELQEATNGFDKELGDGGFGTVYKGKLRDGRVVAVKRLYENNCRRLEQFMNEIEILSHVRHQNLVDLYGWTSRDSKELLLVYEFVPNGTVADHLHGSRAREGILTWPMRLKIAIEAAEALAYLHAIDPPIIHRDIKTSNILLDSSFHVKVADFGLSRWFPTNATHVSTVPQGTPGYLDPEYHQCYQLTHKSDVYSFGVVLIELLSSKPAVDFTRHRKEINLANMALNRIQNGELDQLVDEHLEYQSNQAATKMVTMVAEVAFRCLQVDGYMRPPMKEVLEALVAIQSKGNNVSNGGKETGDNEDDAGLLENIAPMSPDTVMNQWVSSTTTPNTSKN